MKLPAGFDLGASTHTGLVRSANEDDYLVMALPAAAGGLLLAVADGMGGVAGGGEASRAALRGLAGSLLLPDGGVDAAGRMAAGYIAASARVAELAQEVALLRDMGTTLTAVLLQDGAGTLGHIGDSRALLMRGGDLQQLTVDHALRQPHNYLTRCIGGGQQREDPDIAALQLQAGDRVVLLTDGAWSTVGGPELQQALALPAPQAAAEALVQQALRQGAPDNATVLVLDYRPDIAVGRDLQLPSTEAPRAAGLRLAGQPLQASHWPWVLLSLSIAVAIVALLRWSGVFDVFAWMQMQSG